MRPVKDHTWEVNFGEKRDHRGCPKLPCDTHPSNLQIPDDNADNAEFFKYPTDKLPLSQYDPVDQINLGSVVCTTCHDPHGSSPKDEPEDDKQMLRLEWTEFSSLCYECHK